MGRDLCHVDVEAAGVQFEFRPVLRHKAVTGKDKAAEGVVFLDGKVDMQRFGHMGQGGAAQNTPGA